MSIEDFKLVPRPWWADKLGWSSKTDAFEKGPIYVLASDDDEYDETGEKWRHVSFSCKDRLPTWEEQREVRDAFFPPEACVVSVFPPTSEYVNHHPFTLHLWWNKDRRLVPEATAEAVGLVRRAKP